MFKKSLFLLLLMLFASSVSQAQNGSLSDAANLPKIDMSAWLYNAEDDVYYQLGIAYCETPADETYENLAVFVPGGFFTGTENGDGTYTCEINSNSAVGNYSAAEAPIVLPVNTPGYSAMSPLTAYTSLTAYTDQGFIYVHAGCRGRDHGAPAGVTDLKAAIRYIRYCGDILPGDTESIFTFGMSGGGAQSALIGATGNSSLYEPYLKAIGAVQGFSDAVLGSMCWCPITNLDSADEAYEWMMGVTRSGLSEEQQAISDRLAAAFADYVNAAGIKDPDGNILTLEASEEGIFQAGSYYNYMITVIERSLNNFFEDTEFPYTASAAGGRGGFGGPGGMHGNGQRPERDFGGDMPGGRIPEEIPGNSTDIEKSESGSEEEMNFEAIDNITRNTNSDGLSLSGTYETAQDYVDAMNADGTWVIYDAETNTAAITSIADFVKAFKNASKNLGAFDQLDRGQGENTLFGLGDGNGAHFDAALAAILYDLNSDYAPDYAEDFAKLDSAGNTFDERLAMYTPLYFLLESEDGYGTSEVAGYWRIRTGIAQGDCALSTEMNLSLALENYPAVRSVDFETIWGAGHTQAERSGSSTDNFIAWVNDCMNNK